MPDKNQKQRKKSTPADKIKQPASQPDSGKLTGKFDKINSKTDQGDAGGKKK